MSGSYALMRDTVPAAFLLSANWIYRLRNSPFLEPNLSGYRFSRIICFSSGAVFAVLALPDSMSLMMVMSQSFFTEVMAVLRYIACG